MEKKLRNKYIQIAKEFLRKEIDSLEELYKNFPEEIIDACELLINTKDYVIVTGIGKSGHIANKIAATLASTGTPAFFIHPSEASHGDLGMIKKTNTIIAISKSGESQELFDLLEYSKKIGAKIIGITNNKNSTLSKFSDVVICFPLEREACFLNLAPTSSTLISLALGDTIAVLLYKIKNFSHLSFKELHPGGRLGKRLMTASDIMRNLNEIAIVKEGSKFKDVILKITESIGGYCFIVDDNMILKGIVTDGDIRRNILKFSIEEPVESFMNSKNIIYCFKDTFLVEISKTMADHRIMALPVVDIDDKGNKILLGMVHLHDINREIV